LRNLDIITDPPKDLNAMFTLANNWLKPKVLTGRGHGSTYATMLDTVDKKGRRLEREK
jgi:hypothetical protein